MLWSLLAKMNAGNHVPNKKSNYQKFLDSISQHCFEQAYPMLSYFIHVRASSSQTKHQTRENIKPIFDILVNGIQLFRGICAIDGEREVSKVDNEGNIVFGEGESDKVLDFVRNWVSQKGDADLVVIDPYFGLSDLQFIGEAINKDPEYKITVLTSFCNLSSFRGGSDSDPHDEILRFWNENVTSDSTPQIDVVFCGVPTQKNEMPIHDRWWLSSQNGLDFGGSLNGIGGKKISSITVMNTQQVLAVEQRIEAFLTRKQRYLGGEKVKYQVVSV